jgi:O-antigen ligase
MSWTGCLLIAAGMLASQILLGGLWYQIFSIIPALLVGMGGSLVALATGKQGGPSLGSFLTWSGLFLYLGWRQLSTDDLEVAISDAWLIAMAAVAYLSSSFLLSRCRKLFFVFFIFCAACLAQVALALWQYSSSEGFHPLAELAPALNLPSYGDGAGRFISGTFFAKNALAGVLQISCFILLGMAVWGKFPPGTKLVCGWAAGVCAVGIALSGSRAGLMGLVVGGAGFLAVSFFIMSRAYFSPQKIVAAFAVAIALTPCFIIALLYYRSLDFFMLVQRLWDDPYRENLWTSVAPAIHSIDPWFGTGANSFQLISLKYRSGVFWGQHVYAHNDWLQLLLDYGIFGLILGLLFVGWHLFTGFRGAILLSECCTDSPTLPQGGRLALLSGSIGAISGTLFHAFFDYNLHSAAVVLPLAACFGVCSASWKRMPGEFVLSEGRPNIVATFSRILLFFTGAVVSVSAAISLPLEAAVWRLDASIQKADTVQIERIVDLWDDDAPTHSRFSELAGRYFLRKGLSGKGTTHRLRDFRRGADFYRRSLVGRPNDPRLMRNFALCLDFTGRAEEARRMHLRSLALDPLNREAYEYLAAHFFLTGRREEARRMMDIARTKPGRGGLDIFSDKQTTH